MEMKKKGLITVDTSIIKDDIELGEIIKQKKIEYHPVEGTTSNTGVMIEGNINISGDGEIKVSDSFTGNDDKGGARRYSEGKANWDLVDLKDLEGMVRVLEFGCQKYDKHNWRKGFYYSHCTNSLMRHYASFMAGEDIDPESGLSHVDHMLCNAMFLARMYRTNPEKFDDRYKENG